VAVEMILDARDVVGESIVWSARDAALWWVDIVGRRIHRLDPATGRHETWPTPDFPTSIGLRARGGFVVGLTREVCLWQPGGMFEPFAVPEPDIPDNRLNEGRVAPDGSFWVGTMQNNLTVDGQPKAMDRNSGALYRIAPSGEVSRLTPADIGIANTMAWLEDGRFLSADSLANRIHAYDVGPAGGLTNRRVFAAGQERGVPDGSCLDASDRLWNCRPVGAAAILCFDPDGSLARTVEMPCSWPCSCTFGGPDLRTLFVTSARFTMDDDHLAAHPQEGALFRVDVGATGKPEPLFGG
jgi:sugar lactone lactonase YvrE